MPHGTRDPRVRIRSERRFHLLPAGENARRHLQQLRYGGGRIGGGGRERLGVEAAVEEQLDQAAPVDDVVGVDRTGVTISQGRSRSPPWGAASAIVAPAGSSSRYTSPCCWTALPHSRAVASSAASTSWTMSCAR